jgi:2-(1,2-epoxy-1,2-dihydrophenyl)acetyl-CoA isomerase
MSATEPQRNAITLRREGAILHIVLDAPHIRNALTQVEMLALRDVLRDAAQDSGVRVVALRGAQGHFCAGGAIASFGQRPDGEEALSDAERRERRVARLVECAQISELLRTMPKPTVALVEGAAAGAGMIYALSCDLCLASESAFFSTAFSRIGTSGDMGASALLLELAGTHRAYRIMMLAERLDAQAVYAMGLISEVVSRDAFEARAADVLAQLAAASPLVLAAIKENLVVAAREPRPIAVRREAENMVRTLESEDCKEARAARKERRLPRFAGN